jgi:hypothetical protein
MNFAIIEFPYNENDCVWRKLPDGNVECINCGLKFFKPIHAMCPTKTQAINADLIFNNQEHATESYVNNGPGTKLKELFSEIGIKRPGCLSCGGLAYKMDIWGPDGCRERFAEIEQKLEEAAVTASWKEKLTVGLHGYFTVASLINEAIRRAEESVKATQKAVPPTPDTASPPAATTPGQDQPS